MNTLSQLNQDFDQIFSKQKCRAHYQRLLYENDLGDLKQGFWDSGQSVHDFSAATEIEEQEQRKRRSISKEAKADFYEFLERERLFDNGD